MTNVYHAAIPNNSYILQQLDPTFGKLKIGYIRGHYSQLQGRQDMGSEKIETILRRPIEWGQRTKGKNFLAYLECKELQEFFDKHGDFTIVEMDVYFLWNTDLHNTGEKQTYIVVLPFRSWSFKPTFSNRVFGEIPSNELRELIKSKMRKANLPLHIRKRLRDTWLINSAPITSIPLDKLNVKFYDFVLGKAIMGLTVHKESQRTFTGRELK